MAAIGDMRSSNFLSQLGIEVGKLGHDVNAAAGAFPNPFANPGTAGKVKQTLTRLAFVSVLQEAMDKASKNQNFNLETAINDMWVHLDSVRKMAGATSLAESDAASLRLQQAMQKRAELISLISEALKNQHEAQMSVIRNFR
jgi:hypothetical protein